MNMKLIGIGFIVLSLILLIPVISLMTITGGIGEPYSGNNQNRMMFFGIYDDVPYCYENTNEDDITLYYRVDNIGPAGTGAAVYSLEPGESKIYCSSFGREPVGTHRRYIELRTWETEQPSYFPQPPGGTLEILSLNPYTVTDTLNYFEIYPKDSYTDKTILNSRIYIAKEGLDYGFYGVVVDRFLTSTGFPDGNYNFKVVADGYETYYGAFVIDGHGVVESVKMSPLVVPTPMLPGTPYIPPHELSAEYTFYDLDGNTLQGVSVNIKNIDDEQDLVSDYKGRARYMFPLEWYDEGTWQEAEEYQKISNTVTATKSGYNDFQMIHTYASSYRQYSITMEEGNSGPGIPYVPPIDDIDDNTFQLVLGIIAMFVGLILVFKK